MIQLVQRNKKIRRELIFYAKNHRNFWSWTRNGKGSKGSSEEGESKIDENNVAEEAVTTKAPVKVGQQQIKPVKTFLGLPVSRRPLWPLFPLHVQYYTLTNPELIDAIFKSKDRGTAFLSVFLRKDSTKYWGTGMDSYSGNIVSGGEDMQSGEVNPEVITNADEIFHVGVLAEVHQIIPIEMGAQMLLQSHRRIKLEKVLSYGPPLRVDVENYGVGHPFDPNSDVIRAYCQEISATINDVYKLNPLLRERMSFFTQRIPLQDPFALADFAAAMTTADGTDLQKVLEEMDAEERLRLALSLISKEREVGWLQRDIRRSVEEKMTQQQRKYFLMEQMKSIKKELGLEKDDKEDMIARFKDKIEGFKDIKIEAKKAMEEELDKLSALEKNSQEFNTTRNYLDWLTCLPWGFTSTENLDLKRAKGILNEDHYGLDDVKQRILEFIAVGKLRGGVHGKILCFCGPPGVGKTSIGKSIARALNREFYRFSVGGLTDVAEIKGHRRTYVGAMPGKLIQALKFVGTSNPLILIDEVDKLGRGYQGDPGSALLEVLDPSQNNAFVDHYLDVPVDLSKALFICTSNMMDTVPGPLRDRMEIIYLSGYDLPEKVAIAEQYLLPTAMKESGLDKDENRSETLHVTKEALETLARWYCREAGVRNLEKHIAKIVRKLALELVKRREYDNAELPLPADEKEEQDINELLERKNWAVTPENLDRYVGKPLFTSDRLYEDDLPPGVVMGLAWTAMGGTSLYIETSAVAQKSAFQKGDEGSQASASGTRGCLKVTGQLGEVMQESSQIAHHFAQKFLAKLDPDNRFLERTEVHMHVPEGATPKDGPSAGITMVTAILSLARGVAVRSDVAMTGEVSLTGKILPVGGIKEKTIAARRANVKCLLFPKGNKRDFDELSSYLKSGLEVHYASTYDDVYEVAFDHSSAWKEDTKEDINENISA